MKIVEKQPNDAIVSVDKGRNLSSLMVDGLDTLIILSLYNAAMFEGRCPKCGCCYVGWALRSPRHQSCSNCGAALDIFEDGKKLAPGYSPFTAERYFINQPPKSPSPSDKTTGSRSIDLPPPPGS